MQKPLVYDFDAFPALLSAWIDWYKQADAKFSLRWLAKRLGLKSHTHLLRLASGDKAPTDELLAKLAGLLELTVDEFAYTRILAALSRSRSREERAFLVARLEGIRRSAPELLLQADAFEMIARWYHLAILEMTMLPDFQSDASWIAARLGAEVPVDTVRESLERLLRLGLVREEAGGRLVRSVDQLNTTHNVPSAAIRTYHAEMLDKARAALTDVPVAQRYFLGRTMAFDSRKLEEAAALLIDFRTKFDRLLAGGAPDSVYYLALQLFPLTGTAAPSQSEPPV